MTRLNKHLTILLCYVSGFSSPVKRHRPGARSKAPGWQARGGEFNLQNQKKDWQAGLKIQPQETHIQQEVKS